MENTASCENYFISTMSVGEMKSSVAAEDEMAARAAWLHYAGGLTQSAVAKRLGLQPTRAHRLIARASRDGLVRVFVDCDVESCIALENTLTERFNLSLCNVVPDLGDDIAMPLMALSQGGSRFLMRILENKEHALIGVGHGRALSAVVDALPNQAIKHTSFVSLLGGLTRKFSANPYDVIFRLAEKADADAYFLPAPMFADTVEDRTVMLGQTGLSEVMQRINTTTLCLLGIGSTHKSNTLAIGSQSEKIDAQASLRECGVVAELLGQFLDNEGNMVSTPFDHRMIAPTLASLAGKEVVAIAGGTLKYAAIQAALKSGTLTGLITDELTARHLVESAH